MEGIERRMLLGGAGVLGLAAASRFAGAGPLTPPAGPVSPTGKTLSQIYEKVAATESGIAEPRTPVQSLSSSSSASFVIDRPGSYYLTGNIQSASGKNAIEIRAQGVFLDLRGFTVSSGGGVANRGIFIAGTQVSIENGNVTDFAGGGVVADIDSLFLFAQHALHNVHVRNCSPGISLGAASVVSDCSAVFCGGFGAISVAPGSTISRCVAQGNTTAGFLLGGQPMTGGSRTNGHGIIESCAAYSNSGEGFRSESPVVFQACSSSYNTGCGFSSSSATLRDCVSSQNADGFRVFDSTLLACKALGSTSVTEPSRGIGFDCNLSVLEHCVAYACRGIGFRTIQRSILRDCVARYNAVDAPNPANFFADPAWEGGTIFKGCVSENGPVGFRIASTGNLVTNSSCYGASVSSYLFAPGNSYGPVLNVKSLGDLGSTSVHPLANLIY